MKPAIYSILTIAWLIYLSEPTISFKPFSIEFAKPYTPFAWLFLIIAIVLFQTQSYNDGIDKGATKALEYIKERVKYIYHED